MLESLKRLKLIRAAARVEADLVAGDLLQQEAEERAGWRARYAARVALERENAKAIEREKDAARVQKRKVRRAELYQRRKRRRLD